MESARKKSLFAALLELLALSGWAFGFSGAGSGTESDPYVITTVEQLQEMRDELAACYELGRDIDASTTQSWNGGAGFEPVGDITTGFTGKLDGLGHIITGLFIHRPSTDFVALFGILRDGAEIGNVGLADAEITGYSDVGALVGYGGGAEIFRCWSSGVVRGVESGSINSRVGGLVGRNSAAGSILQCYSTVDVTSGAWQVGGLSGYNGHGSVIIDCYATGSVTGNHKVGGLVGDNCYPEGGYVKRCYSTGRVTGGGGGLIGYNWEGGVTYDSYWDVQTSGRTSSRGGAGKTTAEMMQQTTFVNWDFDEIWDIDEGQSYPYFKEWGVVVGLEIIGPDEVAEDFRANYKAIAYYDSNSTRDVTDSALWMVESNDVASIEAGLLTTETIGWPERDVTIYAEYSEGEVMAGAEKLVAIFPVCPTGSALRFDGDGDYVDCGNGSSLNLSEVTVSVWVKTGSTDRGFSTIGAKGNAYDENYGMYVQETTGIVRFQFSSGGSYSSGETFIDSRTNVLDLSWHHAAGTFNGSALRLYIDGSLETTGSTTTRKPDADTGKTLSVGVRRDATPALCFNGTMDEVAVWNRALSGEEIWVNMHRRLAGDEPNLVGYWDFDEGEGQIVYDLSGNGNHGYLGGDPCAIQDSDPAWVESDAPIGICTPYLIAKGAVERGLAHKIASLEELQAAMAEEAVSLDALDDMIRSGNFGDLKKGDIVKAKQMIHSAMQHEQQAQNAVQKGIEKLTALLALLGCEVEPQGSPEVEIEEDVYREVESADIDGDGVVDFADFARLMQHWLRSY